MTITNYQFIRIILGATNTTCMVALALMALLYNLAQEMKNQMVAQRDLAFSRGQ